MSAYPGASEPSDEQPDPRTIARFPQMPPPPVPEPEPQTTKPE